MDYFYILKAAIIVVYTYGLVTLMARNFEEAASSEFLEGIVNFFPVIPSMQVYAFCNNKWNYLVYVVFGNLILFLVFKLVFYFPHLAEFWPSGCESFRDRRGWYRRQTPTRDSHPGIHFAASQIVGSTKSNYYI